MLLDYYGYICFQFLKHEAFHHPFFLTSIFAMSCKTEKPEETYFYKAHDQENVALLSLTIGEKHFFGHYEVSYKGSRKDFGEVNGNVQGDTLKGRFSYRSYGGSDKIVPFVLLRKGEILKLGSGSVSSYLNIPYFLPETLTFKDTDFQFYRVDENPMGSQLD